jgi:cell division protein FtsQ
MADGVYLGPADPAGAVSLGAATKQERKAADQGGRPSKRGSGGSPARRRLDPWRVAFFGVLVLAVIGAGAWALFGSSLLVVRHEDVTGNGTIPASRVLAAAAIRRGTPLASVNTGAAARRVERIDQVLTATVSRSWPDTIVISVRERTPVLAVAGRGEFALIDPWGVTVRWSRHRPAAMPLLAPAPGRLRGSPDVLAAATVLRGLPARLRAMVNSIAAPTPQLVTLHLRRGITVVWGDASQAKAKAGEVLTLLRTGARYYDVSDPSTAVTQG